MLKTELNPVELKALRLALGLDVSQASEICGVTKRAYQYWEAGKFNVPADVVEIFSDYAHTYNLVLKNMGDDIDAWNKDYNDKHPRPQTDDADEYFRLMKLRPKRPLITMPYFRTFEEFTESTNNPHIFSFGIYQSVINHYFIKGMIDSLSDGGSIPEQFKMTKFWIEGGYDDRQE